jgi:uncharacterized membrane protein YjgN (DUF898 family)
MVNSGAFRFTGGAATYLGVGILAVLVVLVTFGLATPFAIVLKQRWRAKHTYINGHRLVFLGTGMSLFGNWIKWFLLTLVTFGIYSFWVVPRVHKWVVENTDFDPSFAPVPPPHGVVDAGAQSPGTDAVDSATGPVGAGPQ